MQTILEHVGAAEEATAPPKAPDAPKSEAPKPDGDVTLDIPIPKD
jgi:hypothetical protein